MGSAARSGEKPSASGLEREEEEGSFGSMVGEIESSGTWR
jgi:hypothetical protein